MVENLALIAFVRQLPPESFFGQVSIRRSGQSFELRHVEDAGIEPGNLRECPPEKLRDLAQFTAAGSFRPLKSAPNLCRGWLCRAESPAALETALGGLYPGAVADWFAARASSPPVTGFRDFAARQSGMYRVVAMLDDPAATAVTRACCRRDFCLKQRLWPAPGLPADDLAEKSSIPCLEPCALLLELARKSLRLEQAGRVQVDLGGEELATVLAALRAALVPSDDEEREGDISSPSNPRRIRLLLDRLESISIPALAPGE